jgi:peptidoglycan/LPS O-acetylase OafA/YrhL
MKVRVHPKDVFGLIDSVPNLLQRKTSSGWFVPQIDGLRFVAIATVFAVHIIAYTAGTNVGSVSSPWLLGNYEHLARGVQLFFVISGFVIAMPFMICANKSDRAPSLKDFFVRRLTRLEPPFLIAMVLTYTSLVLVHHSSARTLLPHLLATCTYTHMMVYGTKSPIAFITWSLEIEIQFYMIAPLIMTALKLRAWRRRLVLASLAIASLSVEALTAHAHPVIAASLVAYLPFFVAGIIACDLAIASDFWRNQRSPRWDAIGGIAMFGAYAIPNSGFWGSLAMSALFGAGVIGAFRGAALASAMALRWLTAIGGMCYTIYLLHVPLIYLFGRFTRHAFIGHTQESNAGIQLLSLPLPILFACSLYFLAIEKPCMNKRWMRQLVQFVLPAVQRTVAAETLESNLQHNIPRHTGGDLLDSELKA